MRYKYIDMHCDSLLKGLFDGQLYDHPGNMLDVAGMVLARQGAQFFAVFFPPPPESFPLPPGQAAFPTITDEALFVRARALLLETVAQHSDVLAMAYSAFDVEKNLNSGLCSAVLTIEDGRAVKGELTKLRDFYDAGVRAMSLTWNLPNCFGYPNTRDAAAMQRGLTEFGKTAVLEMNRLGMLVDVSHMSDGGFRDVAGLSTKPFIATHSNCRALCPHPRNLDDDMIRMLAKAGGVAGVNFGPEFLTDDGSRVSRIDDICRHIHHFIKVGGEDCVGLGTDFDGIMGEFEISGPAEMHLLFEALKHQGLTERQIDKLVSSNVLRVMRDAL